jgi:hypothetical protein
MDTARLIEALKAADAAGDTEAASKLAQALRGASKKPLAETNPAEYNQNSKEFQQRYGPQSDSNFQNARAGFGKAFPDLLRGVQQLAADTMYPTRNASEALRKEQDEVRLRDAPLMRTKAGSAGNIGGNVAAALPTAFIPGVNTYTGAATIGAGLGALQPVGTEDSRAQNAAIGAAGGVAGKYVGGKIGDWASRARGAFRGSPERAAAVAAAENQAMVTGGGSGANAALTGSVNVTSRTSPGVATVGDDISAGLTQSQREIMRRGQAIGMRSTPGQASGSRALQQLEAKLESQPMTSGPFNAIKEANSRVLSREAAASIGEASDTVDSATLDHAFTRISQVFDDAADDVARPIDPKAFLEKFGSVQTELEGVSKGFANNKIVEMLIGHAEKGSATGSQLQSITSKLGKAAYKEMTSPSGDRELGLGLYQMKDYVDDLLQSGMSEARTKAFQQARQQYRNLMMLTSRVGILNPSTGNVNGVSLANLLQQKDKAGFLRGRNMSGLYDAARFAQAFKPIVGDSGTATRSQIQGVTEMAMRIPYNLAAKAYTSPLSVNLASRAGAASRAAGNASRNMLGTAPFYAPYVLPGQGGLLARELADD